MPHYDKRKKLLEALASDPAILEIMSNQDRNWHVGELSDALHPVLQPTVLGLNVNFGETMNSNATQRILLRLLTNDLSGLRSYNSIRRV